MCNRGQVAALLSCCPLTIRHLKSPKARNAKTRIYPYTTFVNHCNFLDPLEKPDTQHPQPKTVNPNPSTVKPLTRSPKCKPKTLNPKSKPPNPKPLDYLQEIPRPSQHGPSADASEAWRSDLSEERAQHGGLEV